MNDPEEASPCTWFHPEPFQLPQHGEVIGIAVMITVEDGDFARRSEALTDAPDVTEVLSRQATTVAGRSAVRAETERSGEAFYPEGTRITGYTVDWEGRVLSAVATSAAEGDYETHVRILDEMMETLESAEFDATCSAATLPDEPVDQPELPEAVARTRAAIVGRAVACDFDALAQIAERTENGFTYSFGDAGDPARFWERQEQEEFHTAPMRYLVGMLNRPFGTVEVQGRTQYVWPSAFAYESWSEVPDEAREALRPLYGDAQLRGFEEFDGYIGYRVGIGTDGDWLFFVAGD